MAATATTPTARGFMDQNRINHINPAWDTSTCRYDPVLDKYVDVCSPSRTIRSVTWPPTARFLELMKAYQDANPAKDPTIPQFNIRDAHNWDEVLLTAGMAEHKYKSKARGIKGLFPRIGRKIGEWNSTLEPISNVLPNGEYSSIVCGSLVLLLRACKRMDILRTKVFDTLGDAPSLLEQVEAFVLLYPSDNDVNEKAMRLYLALLAMIEEIVKWLDHGFWERLKVIVQQDMYGQRLEDKESNLQKCIQGVRDCADLCDKKQTVEISRAIQLSIEKQDQLMQLLNERVDENLQASHSLSEQVDLGFQLIVDSQEDALAASMNLSQDVSHGFSSAAQRSQENLTATKDVALQLSNFENGVKHDMDVQFSRLERVMIKTLNELSGKQLARASGKEDTVNAVAVQLSAQQQAFEWQMKIEHERLQALEFQLQATQMELQRARTPPAMLSQHQMRELLAPFSPQTARGDIEEYIRLASRLEASPELTEAVMASQEFRNWMTSGSSQMLFISEDTPLTKVSSGSFFTASLAQVIGRMQHAMVVSHFFGLHSGTSNGNDPAATMFANLIAQLLSVRDYSPMEWSAVGFQTDHAHLLASRHLPTLCGLFQRLITVMPWGMVFCLIDDFYRLEDLASPDSLRTVVRTLSELVYVCNTNGRSGIKIIATTPDWKGNVVGFVQSEDLVRISRPSRNRSAHLTPKQLQYGMSGDLTE